MKSEILILLASLTYIKAEFNVSPYCELVQNGIKLGSIENCQTYYECQNGVAVKRSCAEGEEFDKNNQICRHEDDYLCYYGSSDSCDQIEKEGFVPLVGACNKYVYCKNRKPFGTGECPVNMIFYNGECKYGVCEDNIYVGADAIDIANICHIMPENHFFGSTSNCNTYMYCLNNEVQTGECPSDKVFDVETHFCKNKNDNLCSRVKGYEVIPNPPPKQACTMQMEGTTLSDSAKCYVYYKCYGAQWTRYECPQNYYYSEASGECEMRHRATPNSSCNRCRFTNKPFVNSVDPECRGYHRCENSIVASHGTCTSGKYFSETLQGCIVNGIGYEDYVRENGACSLAASLSCDDRCLVLPQNNCKKLDDTCDCVWSYSDANCNMRHVDCEATCIDHDTMENCNECSSNCKWDNEICVDLSKTCECENLVNSEDCSACSPGCKWESDKCSIQDSACECSKLNEEEECQACDSLCSWDSSENMCTTSGFSCSECNALDTKAKCNSCDAECLWQGVSCVDLIKTCECENLVNSEDCSACSPVCKWESDKCSIQDSACECSKLNEEEECQACDSLCSWDSSENMCTTSGFSCSECNALESKEVCEQCSGLCAWSTDMCTEMDYPCSCDDANTFDRKEKCVACEPVCIWNAEKNKCKSDTNACSNCKALDSQRKCDICVWCKWSNEKCIYNLRYDDAV